MSADLADEFRTVLRRYARTMADGDGDPPRGLVDELVRIAERHAGQAADLGSDKRGLDQLDATADGAARPRARRRGAADGAG